MTRLDFDVQGDWPACPPRDVGALRTLLEELGMKRAMEKIAAGS